MKNYFRRRYREKFEMPAINLYLKVLAVGPLEGGYSEVGLAERYSQGYQQG